MEKIAFAMMAIILKVPSLPLMILMNVLVIMTIKTTPRSQSKYSILLARLAGTCRGLSKSDFAADFYRDTGLCYKRFISN